jgi:hypothetical protein
VDSLASLLKLARRVSIAAVALLMLAASARAAATGTLKLDVMGEMGAGAHNSAQVIGRAGKVAGEIAPGATLELQPGDYKIVLPIIGGTITKSDIKVEAGRTHTVMITNVAVLQVSVTDRNGKDPGFGVTVASSTPPHTQILSTISGEKYLFAPMEVNVHCDVPPQGVDWTAVQLKPGERTRLTLGEVVPAQLDVKTILGGQPIDSATRVVVYRAGTQSQVAQSAPGASHHFQLDPGDYDVYVENQSGKGHPTATVGGIHLGSGAKVERTVPLD